ncbi:aconitase family protein, partial [Nitrospirota bacterium]
MYEASCGPCIGMGGTPGTDQVSVRSFNRNFLGRSGNKNAQVYLMNPLLCALFAIRGEFTDPLGSDTSDIQVEDFIEPSSFLINDNMLIPPVEDTSSIEVVKGPNIKEVPVKPALKGDIEAEAILKLGDNITTDDIMPAGSKVLPLRSNIPAISEYVFSNVESGFSQRAAEYKDKGFIVIGGGNYGQGSSREHAAIAPMYLGLQSVIAKTFARIHRSNLINFGVLPLVFKDPADYERINQSDRLAIRGIDAALKDNSPLTVEDITQGFTFEALANLNEREGELITKGGLLAYMREKTSA